MANNQALELCWEIEKLPASEQQTKISVMASNLRSRLDDAEALLRHLPCTDCKGSGVPWWPSSTSCGSCKGSGLHPDASAYFEWWK